MVQRTNPKAFHAQKILDCHQCHVCHEDAGRTSSETMIMVYHIWHHAPEDSISNLSGHTEFVIILHFMLFSTYS
jgi:hypothetical protein